MNNNKYTLKIGTRYKAEFDNLKDARDMHNLIRNNSGEGASSWPNSTITFDRAILSVSYNGRIWDKEGREIEIN